MNSFITRFMSMIVVTLTTATACPAVAQVSHAVQIDRPDAAHLKLAKVVRLDFAGTTVSKLMAALSEQTGLTITAAEYLRERAITVRMENVSAASVLDDLDELNDWTWYETLPNEILVTRRRLRMDATPTAIPRMMQATIPKDIRTYLNIPTPTEDLAAHVNSINSGLHDSMKSWTDRLSLTVVKDQSALLTSLAPEILTGNPISFSKLSSVQRTQLLIVLVFPMLRRTDFQLLHGDLLPHVEDVNNAVLKMSGRTTLLIGSRIIDGKGSTEIGFGAQVR